MTLSIISWIIFGALAGWIASIVIGNNKSQSALGNIVVGIVGAVAGGFIVKYLGEAGVSGFTISSLIVAVFGAVLLLAITRGFTRV